MLRGEGQGAQAAAQVDLGGGTVSPSSDQRWASNPLSPGQLVLRLNHPRANLPCSSPSGSAPAHATAAFVIHPNQRPRAKRLRSITTCSQRRPSERNHPRASPQRSPNVQSENQRARAFFFSPSPKALESSLRGKFYYRVFLPSPISDSESFTRKKECTGTGHRPSDVGVSAAFV